MISQKILFSCMLCFIGLTATAQLPMKPVHTIRFSTNEGSFMDVDVSPNGRQLVFDLLGDLYTLPVTGGTAKQLTHGMPVNFHPVWSPDGKRIAFFSDYSGDVHVNVMGAQGGRRKVLGVNERAIFSPFDNNTFIWNHAGSALFTHDSNYRLNGKSVTLPVYVPPGSTLLQFGKSANEAFAIVSDSSGKLVLNAYSKNKLAAALMKFPSLKLAGSSVISPDGYWLVFLRDTGMKETVMLRDLRTGTERPLLKSAFAKQIDLDDHSDSQTEVQRPHYSFSPDSRYVYIGDGGKIHRLSVNDRTDQVIPFQAEVNLAMGPRNFNHFSITHQTQMARYVRYAQATPDNKHLVFNALNHIYIQDLPNGGPRLMCNQSDPQYEPALSPDGKWVAFVTWNDTTGSALWRIDLSGKHLEMLSRSKFAYRALQYTPDGQNIAFVRGHKFIPPSYLMNKMFGALYLININTRQEKLVHDSVPLNNKLSFLKNGAQVFYDQTMWLQRSEKNNWVIFASTPLEDGQTSPAGTGRPENGIGKSISPDGRYIVFSLHEELFLVPTQKTGLTQLYDPEKAINGFRFAKGVDFYWEKGGKMLSWTYGNKFYRIDPDKVIAAAKKNLHHVYPLKGLTGPVVSYVELKPDEVIPLNVPIIYDYAHGTIALTHCRILTMNGDQIIEDGTAIIRDGRFVNIGSTSGISIPETARVIDLTGKTIMPGIVDMHLHLHDTGDIFPNQYPNFLANLAYGVTTARDPSSFYNSFGLGELLRSGQMIGPRLYSTGEAMRYNVAGIEPASNLHELMEVTDQRKIMGAAFIKQYALPDRRQREWLNISSKRYGLNLTNEGSHFPLEDLAMLKDGSTGIEHSIAWGDLYNDYLTVMKLSGSYFTPTLMVAYDDDYGLNYYRYKYWRNPDAKMRRFLTDDGLAVIASAAPADTSQDKFAGIFRASRDYVNIRHAGINVTLGSHGEDQGLGAHNELWELQVGGLTNMEALQAATILGAQAIGIQKDLGSIEAGKIADLVILNSNPLDDIHNSRDVRYVMKDGILYDGNTLDEIWPVKKKCPEWRLKAK